MVDQAERPLAPVSIAEYLEGFCGGILDLSPRQKVVQKGSPDTCVLVFCAASHDPRDHFNHWVPAELKEQVGDSFNQKCASDIKQLSSKIVMLESDMLAILDNEEIAEDEKQAMEASLETHVQTFLCLLRRAGFPFAAIDVQ